MNAADHLATAEQLLQGARENTGPGQETAQLAYSMEAAAHALIALADIAGAPHAPGQTGGVTSA